MAEITEEFKAEAMKEFAKIAGEGALRMFMMMELKHTWNFKLLTMQLAKNLFSRSRHYQNLKDGSKNYD